MPTGRSSITPTHRDRDVDWTTRRADARHNHEQVMAAAREVFAERGIDGTIPEIAARAQVGKATVYRSYPTKEALLEAVTLDCLAWYNHRVQQSLAEPDAFEALQALLIDITERLATDKLLIHAISSPAHNSARPSAELEQLFERGRDQGTIRADAVPADLHILTGGYARTLLDNNVTDPKIWRRYAIFVLDALRPPANQKRASGSAMNSRIPHKR